jgi:phytoene synthase
VTRAATASRADSRLESAFEAVREITRREAGNFYHGLRLTPEPKRSALYSIYAWMREADDIVDEEGRATDAKRTELDAFARRTDGVFDGEMPGAGAEPMWIAFAETVRRFALDAGEFRDLIGGMREDVDRDARVIEAGGVLEPRYATREELARYCYHVASTVGIVCMRVWGTRPGVAWERARELAVVRGRAFQLTNILRDYAGDYEEGRVYLAREDFQRFGLTPADLREWGHAGKCVEMVRSIAAWAGEAYERSRPLDEIIAPDCAPAMWAMTRIYSTLLQTIGRQPSLVVGSPRAHLPTYRKVAIGVRALVRSVTA